MSPEQLEGEEADARSDIFALGCVLFEMVTGRRAFEGKSTAKVVAAIMTTEPPPLTTLSPLAPAGSQLALAESSCAGGRLFWQRWRWEFWVASFCGARSRNRCCEWRSTSRLAVLCCKAKVSPYPPMVKWW
jgi:serine/threonine protein kinase